MKPEKSFAYTDICKLTEIFFKLGFLMELGIIYCSQTFETVEYLFPIAIFFFSFNWISFLMTDEMF